MEEVTLTGLRLYVVFHKDIPAVFFAEAHCMSLSSCISIFYAQIPYANIHSLNSKQM